MKAAVDIQIVWNENKGEVQLFIGDFRIGLPPASCLELEQQLAAARRIPERAAMMANNYERVMHGPIGGAMADAADLKAWGGDPEHESGVSPPTPMRRDHAAGDDTERKANIIAREPDPIKATE